MKRSVGVELDSSIPGTSRVVESYDTLTAAGVDAETAALLASCAERYARATGIPTTGSALKEDLYAHSLAVLKGLNQAKDPDPVSTVFWALQALAEAAKSSNGADKPKRYSR
jgi:hypothetical protein